VANPPPLGEVDFEQSEERRRGKFVH
jgi:hypothetical protein